MKSITRILLLLSSVCQVLLAHADCVPTPEALPPDIVYSGYPQTGYKGAQEFDPLWHRLVLARDRDDGREEYRLRSDRVWYDSLEPIDLGQVSGFIAFRQGCGRVLDLRGRELPVPYFLEIAKGYESDAQPGRPLYELKSGTLSEPRHRYVRFSHGQVAGVSPHEYLGHYSASTLSSGALPHNLLPVVDRFDAGHGLLDLRTMQEVVTPEWHGVGGIGLADKSVFYLLTDDGHRRTVWSGDGKTRLMENIKHIVVKPNWLPEGTAETAEKWTAVLAISNDEDSCRLYDISLNLLMPHSIPLTNGQCPIDLSSRPAHIFARGFDDSIAVYATAGDPRPRWIGSITGEPVARDSYSGQVVVRVETSNGYRYRVFGPDGTRTNDIDFDDFRISGVSPQVRLGDQWLTLLRNGKTTTKRFFPFSM